MAIRRRSPISLETLAIPRQGDIPKQIKDLVARIDEVDDELQPWLQKQRKLTQLRFGTDRRRKIPWKGAANVSIPLADGIIRRWRPGIASLMLDANPIAAMDPIEAQDIDSARDAEQWLTYLFQEKMTTAPEAVRLADYVAGRGHGYTREGWDYHTDKETRVVEAKDLFPGGVEQAVQQLLQQNPEADPVQAITQALAQQYELDPNFPGEAEMLQAAAEGLLQGKEYIELTYRKLMKDRPSWLAVDPVDVITPVDDDPEDADFVCIQHAFTPDTVLRKAQEGVFEPEAAQKAVKIRELERSGRESLRREIKDFLRRTKDVKPDRSKNRVTVWEIFAKMDIDGDGLQERVVLWYAKDSETPLALFKYSFPFETWPVTLYRFNVESPRPIDSRGIVEMLASFQQIENEFHNARLNASQILLSPVFRMRVNGSNYQQSVNWRPGGIIPLANVDDIAPLTHDLRILAQLIQEEQLNQRLAETYIGTFDATLTSLEQSRERRTAAEINAVTSISSSIFGLDARIFQDSFSRSLNKIWNLWLEMGPEETFQRVRNKENPLKKVKKADIGRNYDIRAAGTPANTNRSFQISNVERAMQLLLQPQIMSSGVVDLVELIRIWMQLLDLNLADRVLRSPDEAAAVQEIVKAAQVQAQENGTPPPGGF